MTLRNLKYLNHIKNCDTCYPFVIINDKIFSCKFCKIERNGIGFIYQHLIFNHEAEMNKYLDFIKKVKDGHQCNICNVKFTSKQAAYNHLDILHSSLKTNPNFKKTEKTNSYGKKNAPKVSIKIKKSPFVSLKKIVPCKKCKKLFTYHENAYFGLKASFLKNVAGVL